MSMYEYRIWKNGKIVGTASTRKAAVVLRDKLRAERITKRRTWGRW